MKLRLIVPVLILAVAGWFLGSHFFGGGDADTIDYASVVRGPLRMTVQTTGPLRPVKTVPVGSEVSGTVAWLGADFNDVVKAGQVIARLKPELFESRLAQARATYANALAGLKKAELAVGDLKELLPLQTALAAESLESAKTTNDIVEYNWTRVEALYKQGNAPEAEWRDAKAKWQNAKSSVQRAEISLRQAQLDERTRVIQAEQDVALAKASLDQAQASLELAQRDLDRCTISAPIDGVVLRRLVSVGEPVVSALTAQHLFIVTPDLARMQLYANVSESDIGLVEPKQIAEFTVDACGERTFEGVVAMVRNDPMTIQGVVTYQVLIDVDNSAGLLKPEMTANVSIEVVKRASAVKVANNALRFRPQIEMAQIQEMTSAMQWPPLPAQADGGPDGRIRAGKTLLWKYDKDQLTPAPVWIGITDNRETEILAGAKEGDRFVTNLIRRGGVVGSVKQAMQMANPSNRSL